MVWRFGGEGKKDFALRGLDLADGIPTDLRITTGGKENQDENGYQAMHNRVKVGRFWKFKKLPGPSFPRVELSLWPLPPILHLEPSRQSSQKSELLTGVMAGCKPIRKPKIKLIIWAFL
jgi:hypothetical protein